MSKLQAALNWAKRGFRVFPLQENSKLPTAVSFTTEATTDPAQIREWWTRRDPLTKTTHELDYNIGMLTTGYIVADVDVKDSRRGLDTFARLGMDFDTLTCQTPSGGYHLIYSGDAGQSPLAGRDSGIDIRSHNGYIVAPGSTIGGHEYTVCIDQPVAPFPEELRQFLRPVREKKPSSAVPLIDLDKPENIEIGAHYLAREAPTAIEGTRNNACFAVAAHLRDLAISEDVARELMVEHWNERCEPPLDLDEMFSTIGNAFHYAKNSPGTLAPEATFKDIAIIEPPAPALPVPAPHINGSPFKFGNMIDDDVVPPRPWIFGDFLLARVITMLVSAGGGGKSVLMLTIAAHLAAGKEFLGHRPKRPGKSIIYNAEDELGEASLRLAAICDHYELDRNIVVPAISLVDSDMIGLRVVEGRPPRINESQIASLLEAASDPEVRLIGLDPLVEIHSANENDNIEMDYVMGVLRFIARKTDTAILVTHHTAKPPAASSNAWAGQQFAGRGASAIPAAGRITFTLFPAADEDCEEIGIRPKERKKFVRMDAGKRNFSAPGATTSWLRWVERSMRNGDKVGVLTPHNILEAQQMAAETIGDVIFTAMAQRGSGSLSFDEAAQALRESDYLMGRESDLTVRRRLERLFLDGLETPMGTLRVAKVDGARRIIVAA